ncbi:MAG: alpha/beta hydrolase [Thermoleophilia bacterium]
MSTSAVDSSPRDDTAPHPPPVLLVHGALCDAGVWTPTFMPYLHRHGIECEAVSLRQRGCAGRTARLHDYVDAIEAAVAQMSAPPVVVGHSMGGMVLQRYLERSPVLAGAVLMASLPPGGLGPAMVHAAVRHPGEYAAAAMIALHSPMGAIRRLVFSRDVELPPARGIGRWESPLAALELLRWDPPDLPANRPPMLVLGGADDVCVSPVLVRETARRYGAECMIFQGVAHAMMLDTRWESVAEYLVDWIHRLARVTEPAPRTAAHGDPDRSRAVEHPHSGAQMRFEFVWRNFGRSRQASRAGRACTTVSVNIRSAGAGREQRVLRRVRPR